MTMQLTGLQDLKVHPNQLGEVTEQYGQMCRVADYECLLEI